MSWSEEDFFEAFSDAGMLVEALYQPSIGDAVTVKVGFVQPDALLMSEMVQATQYHIEFETSVMPNLRSGEWLTISGNQYKVRGAPEKKADGFFSTVELARHDPA